jgi:protein-S-isoprenylcysteine O-methyltransferase Ste14
LGSEGYRGALEIPATVAFFLLMAVTVAFGSGEIRALRLMAVVTGVGCLPLIFLPMFTLKRHGEVPEGESYMATTRVVDRGLFGVVRHPQYLGYILMGITFALVSQRWYSVGLAALGSVFFLLHTRQEEGVLQDRFGPEYVDYMARVPALNLLSGLARALRREQNRSGSV